ncbi:MAG: tetratricopeptide repeat protein [Chloroflexota bacterium]
MDHPCSFGVWVKTLRIAQGWSQVELAEQVDCSVSTIRKLETNERHPSKQLAKLLAAHLHVPEDTVATFLEMAHSGRRSPKGEVMDTRTACCVRDQHGFRPLTPMLGRATELAAVGALLQREDIRLVTLLGLGGVGKTRLAYAIADHLFPLFAEGALVVDLASIASVDELLIVVTSILELPGSTSHSLPDRVLTGLQDREVLLVLDNFDHLLDAIPFVRQILAMAPRAVLLLTSRVPLQINGEQVFRVGPLPLPAETEVTSLPQLSANPAVALLVTRVQALLPDFQLTEANANAVATICRQVDGLPLALELAAAQLLIWNPESLVQRLMQDVTILSRTSRDGPPRQHSLQATVRWSYELLDQEAQTIFIGMSVFAGGGSLEAITAICEGKLDSNAADLVARHLTKLLEYSLVVTQDTAHNDRRFTMLETIRAAAHEELFALGQATILKQRHAEYFTQWAEQYSSDLIGSLQTEVLHYFDYEIGNIHAALTWCREQGDAVLLARLCIALWRFWYIRGLWQEGILWHQQAMALSDTLPSSLHAALLSNAAGFSLMYSDYAQAAVWLDDAIARYRLLDDALGLARALNRRGMIVWYQGQLAQARAFFEEGLAFCRRVDCPRDTANLLANLGCVSDEQGRYDQAIAFHQASLQVRRELGDTHGIINDLLNLGNSALLQRDHTTAQACFEEGLTYTRSLSYHYEEALFLMNLGTNACYQLRLDEAHMLLSEGLAIMQRLQDRFNVARALSGLGLVAVFSGNYTVAIELLNQSLQHFSVMDSWISVPECLERLAGAYVSQGEYQRASWLLVHAEQIRVQDGVMRSPVEEVLYEQAWEQLNTQGFTRENTSSWAVGRVREQVNDFIAHDFQQRPAISFPN